MWTRLRSSLSYANVVSTLCLFLVIGGGGAYAKTKLINGTELKPRSVTAAKIKKHSLTSTEVNVGKLGRVADAAKLGGKPPSAYQPAGRYQPAGSYLAANGTAVNASALGGLPPSAFLPAGGTAANANALGGRPASAFAPASEILGGSGGPGGQALFTYPPLGLSARTGTAWNIIAFTNATSEQIEVSRSSTTTIQQIAGGTEWDATPRSSAVVETYVFRSIVRPTVALTVVCGFDHDPDIMNCSAIGIGGS